MLNNFCTLNGKLGVQTIDSLFAREILLHEYFVANPSIGTVSVIQVLQKEH